MRECKAGVERACGALPTARRPAIDRAGGRIGGIAHEAEFGGDEGLGTAPAHGASDELLYYRDDFNDVAGVYDLRVGDVSKAGPRDETLVAQEIVRFANRSDITEETVRFRAHLEHWRALSDAPEPCGRKLDFLLQEMNREINTIGSKVEGARATEVVIAAKAELERVREQVQNVE